MITDNTATDLPAITRIREEIAFTRIAALLTGFFFLFVVYSPSALAIKHDLEQPSPNHTVNQSGQGQENLAKNLQQLKEKISEKKHIVSKRIETENTVWQSALDKIGLSNLKTEDLRELSAVNQRVTKLHKQELKNFKQIENQLLSKGLPDTILERHHQAVEKYLAHYQQFQTLMQSSSAAKSLQSQHKALQELDEFMQEQKFKRSQQPFDPNDLPFTTPKAEDIRKPVTNSKELSKLIQNDDQNKLAESLLNPVVTTAVAQSTQPGPDYLAETIDIQLTDAIQQKAMELNNNPVQIYNWVRNTIEFIPTYGSIQGADMTLQTLKGNAFDTASLLIALLRASDIHARYAYGTIQIPVAKVMNWVGGVDVPEAAMQLLGQGGIPNSGLAQGGKITHIQLEHIWAEAWIDYIPSQGAIHKTGDTWIPLDASFKQYEYTDPIDIENQVPFDTQNFTETILSNAVIDETTGTVENIDQQFIEDQLTQYQQQVAAFIDNLAPNATVGELLSAKTVQIQNPPVLGSGLPYQKIITSNQFSSIPDSLRYKYQLQLKDLIGNTVLSQVLSLPSIAGRTLALSFTPKTSRDEQVLLQLIDENITDISQLPGKVPGYLVNVEAELVANNEILVKGGVFQLGSELSTQQSLYQPGKGWLQSTVNIINAGEYHAIGINGIEISQGLLERLKTQIEISNSEINNFDDSNPANTSLNVSTHELFGSIFQSGIYSYYAMVDTLDLLSSLTMDITAYRLPSYGTFSNKVETSYLFGNIPVDVEVKSVLMDINRLAMTAQSNDNNKQSTIDFVKTSGARLSAYEHIVPEQLFEMEAISAVKALAIAAAQGQKIYTLTRGNLNELTNINIDAGTKKEISNAISSGREVVVSQNSISYRMWTGVGYIIVDPNTGSGEYRISGGANGGELPLADSVNKFLGVFVNFFGTNSIAVISTLKGVPLLSAFINWLEIAESCPGVEAAVVAFINFQIGARIAQLLPLLLNPASFVITAIILISIMVLITTVINRIVTDIAVYNCKNR